MSDDRLFASNNAIGRKWYFINIVILCIIALVTQVFFNSYIFKNVTNDTYMLIADFIRYFVYLVYLITFFALLDRRLYDISGDRRNNKYKSTSGIISFCIIFQFAVLVLPYTKAGHSLPIEVLQQFAYFTDFLFLIIVFAMGFIRGSISNMSYEEYKNKIKYN